MPVPLEYASPRAKVKPVAIVAMTVGLCSGPVSYALMFASVHNNLKLEDSTKALVGIACLVLTLVAGMACGLIAARKLSQAASHDRHCAVIGAVAPFFWGIGIIPFLPYYVISHLPG
jgi:hypothetical protein